MGVPFKIALLVREENIFTFLDDEELDSILSNVQFKMFKL